MSVKELMAKYFSDRKLIVDPTAIIIIEVPSQRKPEIYVFDSETDYKRTYLDYVEDRCAESLNSIEEIEAEAGRDLHTWAKVSGEKLMDLELSHHQNIEVVIKLLNRFGNDVVELNEDAQ